MIIKERTSPLSLCVWESLYYPTHLSKEQKKEYVNQVMGFEGEQQFDRHLEHVTYEYAAIHDLMLTNGGQLVQIDSLLLTNNKLYVYEIKHYSLDYTFTEDGLYAKSGFMVPNPLSQLQKNRIFLYNLIRSLGYQLEVEAFVFYINTHSYLYELPREKPILFPHQLAKHLSSLNKAEVPLKKQHKRLMENLKALHISEYRSDYLHTYAYHDLKKGLRCVNCSSLTYTHTVKIQLCTCGSKEAIKEAILRNIEEYRMLFPNEKLTTQLIHDWCGKIVDKQRIQRILREHFQSHGTNKNTYYS